MAEANGVQGVIEVQNQNLNGSEPSTDRTNLHQPSLRRCSVSESDTDPTASATNPRIYRNKIIPVGRTESQPNVSGLGFMND